MDYPHINQAPVRFHNYTAACVHSIALPVILSADSFDLVQLAV